MNSTTIFLAGPSWQGRRNIVNFGKVKDYNCYINKLANVLADTSKIGFLPDEGLPLDVVRQIKSNAFRNCVLEGYYPKYGQTAVMRDNLSYCDKGVEVSGGWTAMNTEPSKYFDFLLCIGLSAGVLTEIAHTKIHRKYSNSKVRVVVDLRTISHELNPEIEADIPLIYFSSWDQLSSIIVNK